jgi:deoxyribodipyrimidine photo-lyase
MSNRGRQIVASCFVNELQLDWRYGAAYFETQLIDYDPAINWGNWQYLAGVGADPRSNDNGGRHFDLIKQQQRFDPKGEYIQQWLGSDASVHINESVIDHIDANGWPIE